MSYCRPTIDDIGYPDQREPEDFVVRDVQGRVQSLEVRVTELQQYGGGGGAPTVADVFNTMGVTTLRGVDVVGFEDAANDIDARLTALGY